MSRRLTVHAALTLLALLAGGCAVDDGDSGGTSDGQDAGRPDLPTMIDAGGSDAAAEDSAPDAVEADVIDLGSAWEPGALELRTREEVCSRWLSDRQIRQASAWQAGEDDCDPGVLHETAIEDALRYTNVYRWLNGLPAVVTDPELNRKAQLCAVIMRGLGDIEHEVPETVDCYTADGSEAAQSSNLALGPRHPAPAIDLYMIDNNVDTLGHRRWILNPTYRTAGFGLADRYSCQWVINFDGSADPRWLAFPNPGIAPLTERPTWSFTAGRVNFDASTRVEVYDVETGQALDVSQYIPDRRFGPESLAFTPEGWSFERTYEVRILDATENGGRVDIVYRTTPTLCD